MKIGRKNQSNVCVPPHHFGHRRRVRVELAAQHDGHALEALDVLVPLFELGVGRHAVLQTDRLHDHLLGLAKEGVHHGWVREREGAGEGASEQREPRSGGSEVEWQRMRKKAATRRRKPRLTESDPSTLGRHTRKFA